MKITGLIFILFFTITTDLIYSQKAYDAIYYTGKSYNINIQFLYGFGYIQGSEIKTINIKNKKTSTFLPDLYYNGDSLTMKFYHFSYQEKKFDDFFLIQGVSENVDSIPETFKGTYFLKGKNYNFELKKIN